MTHNIKVSFEDVDVKRGNGYEIGVSYKGENKDGIDLSLAMGAVHAILLTQDVDAKELDKAMVTLVERLFPGKSAVISSGKDKSVVDNFNDATENVAKKHDEEEARSANEMFAEIVKDERWMRALRKESYDTSRVVAFAATCLHTIETINGKNSKQYKYIEDLFLREIATEE